MPIPNVNGNGSQQHSVILAQSVKLEVQASGYQGIHKIYFDAHEICFILHEKLFYTLKVILNILKFLVKSKKKVIGVCKVNYNLHQTFLMKSILGCKDFNKLDNHGSIQSLFFWLKMFQHIVFFNNFNKRERLLIFDFNHGEIKKILISV